LNNGSSGWSTYFRNNTVNDAIIFNITGTDSFNEGDLGTAIITTVMSHLISMAISPYIFLIQLLRNLMEPLTINRTVAGLTNIFNAGGSITGNYSYTNNAGGITYMGLQGQIPTYWAT